MEQTEKKQPRKIIRVKNLRKVYRIGDERVVALNNINLEVLQGQVCCIVGTSGSGKSTLLNQLAGLEKPSKGGVFIGRTNISTLSENRLAEFRQRHLGFVFQSYNLMPTMTALENVSLPMIFKGVPRRKRKKAALAMLTAVGLKKRAYHKPTQMSGGQQQRVGIARAFVTRPKVVFADEPTGNLDTKTTIDVMKMMVRFARKYNETLIIVTHDPEIADYADRVITLIDGEIKGDELRTPLYDGVHDEQAAPAPAPEALPAQEALPETDEATDAEEPEQLGDAPELPEDVDLPGEGELSEAPPKESGETDCKGENVP